MQENVFPENRFINRENETGLGAIILGTPAVNPALIDKLDHAVRGALKWGFENVNLVYMIDRKLQQLSVIIFKR
jgi:hypothetical protein